MRMGSRFARVKKDGRDCACAARGPLTRRAAARERLVARDGNDRRICSVVSWPCAVRYATVSVLSVVHDPFPGFRSRARPFLHRTAPVRGPTSVPSTVPFRAHTAIRRTGGGAGAGGVHPECDAGARGTGGGNTTAVAAAAAAAAAARPVRLDGAAVPPVRPQVLRAPVQQLGPVRPGGRLRDRRRVRVPVPGGRQRASAARPNRPSQERLSGRALEYHRYIFQKN